MRANDSVPPTDQLGQPRVDQCDIGAIEFQPSDTTPPMVTIVSVTPDTLWPPNGRLVPVTIVATITDAGSGVDPSTTAYAVEDEYGSVEPSGSSHPQTGWPTTPPRLASRRRGAAMTQDGRRYTITVSAQDNEGNEGVTDIHRHGATESGAGAGHHRHGATESGAGHRRHGATESGAGHRHTVAYRQPARQARAMGTCESGNICPYQSVASGRG